jgi:hypothetical protein
MYCDVSHDIKATLQSQFKQPHNLVKVAQSSNLFSTNTRPIGLSNPGLIGIYEILFVILVVNIDLGTRKKPYTFLLKIALSCVT